MGQKVNPISMRVGVIRSWGSTWFSEKDYARLLHEDIKLKKQIKKSLYHAGIAKVEISRAANKCSIDIHTARPGVVIGKRGAGLEELKAELQKTVTGGDIAIQIKEVRKAEMDAQLVAENIAQQLERRMSFRRVIKRSVQSAMKLGASGIKVMVGGRLGGADIARSEWYMEGSVPLHTLRANVDYGFIEAKTTYGLIGVKVWINHGLVLTQKEASQEKSAEAKAV